MTSKQIYQTAFIYFGRDFTKNRKIENVYLRALVNTVCRKLTNESLEMIGLNTKTDHATVLHSLNNFNYNYIKQLHPFDVYGELTAFEMYLKNVSENYIPDVIDYRDLKIRFDILEIRHANLIAKHKELLLKDQQEKHQLEEKFVPLIKECFNFSERVLDRFIITRVRPFKLMEKIK